MTPVLDAVGVGEDPERLYRRVLRADGQPASVHAMALGWPLDRVEAACRPLVSRRLVHLDAADALVADHPRTAISRLVDRESARLDQRRRELDEVRIAVSDFAADHRAGRAGVIDPMAVEVLSPDVEVSAVEELLRTTSGTIRTTHLAVAAGPITDPGLYRLAQSQVLAGRELRSIYPASALDHPEQRAWVEDWGEMGEQQRLVEAVGHEFVVFGEAAVVAPPTWGSTEGGIVVFRLPLVVSAFTRLFDDAWATGLLLPSAEDGSDGLTRLLALLGAGFKDEGIARYQGVGVRTVRRRVAEAMDELGVRTRFQLGVAAERRSMLGRPRPRR